jgi:hypothetical protein
MASMTPKKLRDLMERVERWPPEAQEEALAVLEAIEEEFVGGLELTREDPEPLERSAEDVREGRFASEEQVREVLDRYRRS